MPFFSALRCLLAFCFSLGRIDSVNSGFRVFSFSLSLSRSVCVLLLCVFFFPRCCVPPEEFDALWRWRAASYLVLGLEVGPGTRGMPCIHGYVELFASTHLGALRRFLGRASWQRRAGTAESATAYCARGGCWASRGPERRQAAPPSAPGDAPGSC